MITYLSFCIIVLWILRYPPNNVKPLQNRISHKALNLIIALIFFIFSIKSIAQRLTPNQTNTIRKTIFKYLDKEANLRILENGKAAFLPIGKDTLFNISGLRFVFKLKGDSAIRLDKSVYHGSNFHRYLFQHGGKMMSLGGYGMFVTNNNLEAFNPESQEWYLIQTQGDIPKSIKGAGLRFGSFIYILNNSIDGNNLDDTRADNHFYRLDLKDMSWTQFKEFRPDHLSFIPEDFFYLRDYVIAKGINHCFVYNLKTQEYIYSNNDALGLKQFTGYNTNIHENLLKTWVLDSARTVINDPLRDIDVLWKENQSLIQPLELNPSLFQQYPQTFYACAMGLLLLVFILLLIRNRRNHRRNNPTLHPLVQQLLQVKQTSLTQEELDTLLGIAHMEGESKKTKRHRLLSMIESQYPGLIERQKDSSDKRRFLYFIHQNED